MRIADLSLLAIFGIVACGEKPPPDGAFILTDKQSFGFGTEFNRPGVIVGASLPNSLIVKNEGLTDLSIDDFVLTGDDAFFMRVEGQECREVPPRGNDCDPLSSILPVKVKGKQETFVQLIFTPRDVRVYGGTLTIKSNAENVKNLEIKLCGVGVRTIDDAGTLDRPDGGCTR
ncbi:MAG: hypothetical protein JNK82_00260 [Myxococcaceae bacterium]|nr:hypothetical protein [Myxococcaceae bacterium]